MPPPSIDRLLELRPFVRSLARQLASDGSLADDIEQEAWVRALQKPPAHEQALKGWFSRVVRNVLINKVTSEQRRTDRELLAAEEREPEPSHEHFAKELNAALEGLPKAHAEVIRLRFYEGLSAREVASRLNVPVATVRTRLRRGTERMRDDLDRRYGGDRSRWLGCLIQLAAPPPTRSFPPFAIAITSAAVTAVAIFAFLRGDSPSLTEVPAREQRESHTESARVDAIASPLQRQALASSEQAPTRMEGAELSLRVRWSDGAPAAGIGLSLKPLIPSTDIEARQSVVSAEGRASWSSLAPGRWILRSTAGKHAELELRAGETTELDWRLGTPRSMSLHVQQERPGGDTKIHLSLPDEPTEWIEVGSTDATDSFRLTHFEPESWVVAVSRRRNMSFLVSLDHPRFSNAPNPHLELPLEHVRAPLRVTVRAPDGTPLPDAKVRFGDEDPPPIRHADGLLRRQPILTEPTGADGSCRVFSMGTGGLDLTVTHPDWADWNGRIPNQQREVLVQLQPQAEVGGVVYGPDGAEVADARVRWESGSRLGHLRSGPHGQFRLKHLAPGPLTIEVTAELPGQALRTRTTFDLHLGQRLSWSPTLSYAPTLRGQALTEYGLPLAGMWVALIEGPHSLAPNGVSPSVRWSAVDGNGEFSFGEFQDPGSPTGRVLRLFAERKFGTPLGWLDSVPYGASDLRLGPIDTGPATATLRLRSAAGSAGSTPPELLLVSPYTPAHLRGQRANDEWIFEGLPAGEWTVLSWPDHASPTPVETLLLAEGENASYSVASPLPWGHLTARIFDPDGEPEPPFAAEIARVADPTTSTRAHRIRRSDLLVIDPSGTVAAQAPPGEYLLTVHEPGMIRESRRVEILPGESTQLDIDLSPGRPMNFRVDLPEAERRSSRTLSFEYLDSSGELRLESHWRLRWGRPTQEWTAQLPPEARQLRAYVRTDGVVTASTQQPLPNSVAGAAKAPLVVVDLRK